MPECRANHHGSRSGKRRVARERLRLLFVLPISVISLIFLAEASLAQSPSPSPTPTPADVLESGRLLTEIKSGSFWIVLGIAALFGALGGLVYELLTLQGGIEVPHKATEGEPPVKFPWAIRKFVRDWGVFARLMTGGLAAIAVLLIVTPGSAFRLIATSIVAGSAGSSIFRALQERLRSMMAESKADQVTRAADDAEERVQKAKELLKSIRQALGTAAQTTPGEGRLVLPEQTPLDLDRIIELEVLLGETRGVLKAATQPTNDTVNNGPVAQADNDG